MYIYIYLFTLRSPEGGNNGPFNSLTASCSAICQSYLSISIYLYLYFYLSDYLFTHRPPEGGNGPLNSHGQLLSYLSISIYLTI